MSIDLEPIAREQAKEELFAHRLYDAMAKRFPEGPSRSKLSELAEQEHSHLHFWLDVCRETEEMIHTSGLKHRLLVLASRVLGPAFTIRWLERNEDKAIATYRRLLEGDTLSPEQRERVERMLHEEEEHEEFLERGIEDERRVYLGAAVLGLNDALVELTGALTGLVSSISDPRLIAFAGLVVGVAASMSMAASNFLSVDIGEATELRPGKAAAYTGTAYILVVVGLVMPFFLLDDRRLALAVTWGAAIVIIAAFSYYSSVMQATSFRRRFGLMVALGLGVAAVSYLVGRLLGAVIGIDVG